MKLHFKVILILMIFVNGISADTCTDIADVDNVFLNRFREMETIFLNDCKEKVLPWFNKLVAVQTQDTGFDKLKNQTKVQEETINSLSKMGDTLQATIVENYQIINNLTSRNKLLQSEKINSEQTVNSLNAELKSKDDQILRLQYEKEELEKQIKEQRSEVSSSCLNKPEGEHMIKVPEMDAFPVFCDNTLAGSGWTVIQRRKDGSENFNRKWRDYADGFGQLNGEFFIGLKKLHLMTKSVRHELYIYAKEYSGKVVYAQYTNFRVDNQFNKFKIKSLEEYSGDMGDIMKPSLNIRFSTSDDARDYCKPDSGWWFYQSYCNYRNDPNGKYNGYLYIMNKYYTFIQIMIRPYTKRDSKFSMFNKFY